MALLDARRLEPWVRAVLESAGAPVDAAGLVAGQLVDAELAGRASHGLNLLPDYVTEIRAGVVDPGAEPEIATVAPAWVAVDGRRAPGAVVLDRAYRATRELAEAHGLGLATIGQSGHLGHLGAFAERAARGGLVALIAAGTAALADDAVMAPPEARRAMLGTNPIAVAVPTTDGPFVVDLALTRVTWYEAIRAARAGRTVAHGSVHDAAGRPSDDPSVLLDGGTIMPLGEHRGFALALAVALVAGLGAGPPWPWYGLGGVVVLLVDPARAGNGYDAAVTAVLQALRTTPTFGGDAVRLPGDRLARARRAPVDDIEIDDALCAALSALGAGEPPAVP